MLRLLARKTNALISVDTTKAAVAREAIGAGARIVNDTSALADDPGMAAVVRDSGCAVILMHRRGTPATMQEAPHYDSLFPELLAELSARIEAAVSAGIARERIFVDPGIGFGKRMEDNLALHRHLGKLHVLGRPIVFGPSRKRFLGTLTGSPAGERIFGTAASVAAAVLAGAHVVRVHDVKAWLRPPTLGSLPNRGDLRLNPGSTTRPAACLLFHWISHLLGSRMGHTPLAYDPQVQPVAASLTLEGIRLVCGWRRQANIWPVRKEVITMRSDNNINQKVYRQYALAEMQKRLVISNLYDLIEELENRPRIKQPYPFPYNGLPKGIHSMLDWIEEKYLQKYWGKHSAKVKD